MKSLTPIQIRVVIYVLLILFLGALSMAWLANRDANALLKSSAEQGVRTDQAAGEVAGAAAEGQAAQAADTGYVHDAKADYQRGYEDAKRNDPTVAPWADRPVPQRMRDLARKRRLARERSGCSGAGCPDDDGASGREL